MKKVYCFLIVLALTLGFVANIHADSTEKVRVIKFDADKDDLVVERTSGEKLLIQHNRVCGSMTTEFPVYLLWSGDTITKLKVAENEICTVYNFGPYSGDVTIAKRIKSDSMLEKDHLAELIWKGAKYRVDYGDGCTYLRDFENKAAYVNAGDTLTNATLYLPGNRGECTIKSAEFMEQVEQVGGLSESPVKNLQHKAENNQSYFYWDKDESDKKWYYLLSWSKYQLNPDDYQWSQMPNLRFTTNNTYTVKGLVNNRLYYFYFSARDVDGNIASWTEVQVMPVKNVYVVQNNPDPEEFEISVYEDNGVFHLTWPDKSEKAGKYLIQFFVNGKRQFLKVISGSLSEYTIEDKPEYENAKLKFDIRSIPKTSTGVRYYDGIYWENKAE